MANNEKLALCSSQTTPPLEASSWNVIKQDTPNTVYFQPVILEAFSSGNDAYEGASASKKAVIYFATPLPAGTYLIMPWDQDGSFNNTLAYHSDAVNSSESPFPFGVNDAFWSFRIRQIVDVPPVETQNLTWNTFAGFTMDAGYEAQSFMNDTYVLDWGGNPVTVDSGDHRSFGRAPTIKVVVVNQLFGLVIDCKIAFSTYTHFLLYSVESNLSGIVPASNGQHIYAVKMA